MASCSSRCEENASISLNFSLHFSQVKRPSPAPAEEKFLFFLLARWSGRSSGARSSIGSLRFYERAAMPCNLLISHLWSFWNNMISSSPHLGQSTFSSSYWSLIKSAFGRFTLVSRGVSCSSIIAGVAGSFSEIVLYFLSLMFALLGSSFVLSRAESWCCILSRASSLSYSFLLFN